MYIAVGIGGMIGALLRYSLGLLTLEVWHGVFPLATFLANMMGSFLLAFFTAHLFRFSRLHPYIATGIGTGIIGSFTTFSTFSIETVRLLQGGAVSIAFFYVLCSIIGGLWLAHLGFLLGDKRFQQTSGERVKK